MKKYLPTAILALIGLFVVMFVFRLAYGYIDTPDPLAMSVYQNVLLPRGESFQKSNFASVKYSRKAAGAPGPVLVDQKYERVAETTCETSRFDEDEDRLQKAIGEQKGLIQYEQRQGRTGARRLELSIGVPPERFDDLYGALQDIGRVTATQITKTDKTNEYLDLKAKIASLNANLESLNALKTRPGSIEELMKLEERMLLVQEKLQSLGVSLGAFDAENEFNTIRFTLMETKTKEISFVSRIKVALEWTVQYYVLLMVGLAFALLSAVLMILAIDRAHRLWIKMQ